MGLFDKLFGRNPRIEHDAVNKRVRQTVFNEVTEFDYTDFYDLSANKSYDRFFAGNLKLPSGQVVCTDPLYRELGLPQSWTIMPGEYPVYLYIGLDDDFAGRVAYAELSFRDEIPASWELSLIAEKLLEDDFAKGMNGLFPVENGLGSFSDYQTWKLYNKEIDDFYLENQEGNYYIDVLEQHFKSNVNTPESSRGEDWINYTPANAKTNIIMFGSGLGDGLYPRYAGFDKNRQVIKLIVDFIQLTGDPGEQE